MNITFDHVGSFEAKVFYLCSITSKLNLPSSTHSNSAVLIRVAQLLHDFPTTRENVGDSVIPCNML